jgi:hypothetical protein
MTQTSPEPDAPLAGWHTTLQTNLAAYLFHDIRQFRQILYPMHYHESRYSTHPCQN